MLCPKRKLWRSSFFKALNAMKVSISIVNNGKKGDGHVLNAIHRLS